MSKNDRAEAAAFMYVPAIVGARLEEYDHSGRQGAVDALLHYPDGRIASLEVTSAAADRQRQLYFLLAQHETLPNPGSWSWMATIDDPRDLPELLSRVESLILKCENLGITYPSHAYEQAFGGDPDFAWIVGSTVTLWGDPKLSKIRGEDGAERPLFLTQGGSGGTVDDSLNKFNQAVDELLAEPHVQKRIRKLTRDGAEAHRDEQHLFLLADGSALPYGVFHALALRDVEPPGVPNLPGTVTHLWVAVPFSPWLILGRDGRWIRYERIDYDG